MRKIKQKESKLNLRNICFNFSFAIISFTIIFVFLNNLLVAFILELILGIVGLLYWRSKITNLVFGMGGLWGSLLQVAIISLSNSWRFVNKDNLLIFPFWMIIIWANSSAFIYESVKEIKKLRGEYEH